MQERIVKIVAIGLFLGAAIGSLVGATLGKLAPGYYRGIFGDSHDQDFNAVQVGLGLGLTQGLIIGAVSAIAIAAIVAWHDVKSRGG